jgi:sRNA-binding carbon storage regulator CsrA
VRLTVRDRRGSCVLVAVAAPLDVLVTDEGGALRPAATSSSGAFYLLWLLTGESLRIGEAMIVVGDAPGGKRKVRGGQRQVRIAVIAPPGLVIRREEIARNDPQASPGKIASAHVADTHGYVVEDAA